MATTKELIGDALGRKINEYENFQKIGSMEELNHITEALLTQVKTSYRLDLISSVMLYSYSNRIRAKYLWIVQNQFKGSEDQQINFMAILQGDTRQGLKSWEQSIKFTSDDSDSGGNEREDRYRDRAEERGVIKANDTRAVYNN